MVPPLPSDGPPRDARALAGSVARPARPDTGRGGFRGLRVLGWSGLGVWGLEW